MPSKNDSRSPRTLITLELIKIVREQLSMGKSIQEISLLNGLSIMAVRGLADKILQGQNDENLIKKKGER
jgi:hypothetical protein